MGKRMIYRLALLYLCLLSKFPTIMSFIHPVARVTAPSPFHSPPKPFLLLATPDGPPSENKGMPSTVLPVVPSPSGVNALPGWQQQSIFFVAFAILTATTILLAPLVHTIPTSLPFAEYLWHPELLGFIFVAAGVSHFILKSDFENIYPPVGTWGGLWRLPGSAEFHVAWTGYAEILGGLGLILGGFLPSHALFSSSAASLCALSFAVYPANLYMYTHGAELPRDVKMEPEAHYARFAMQVVLCGVLAGLV